MKNVQGLVCQASLDLIYFGQFFKVTVIADLDLIFIYLLTWNICKSYLPLPRRYII